MRELIINRKTYFVPDKSGVAAPRSLRNVKTSKGTWVFLKGRSYFIESPKKSGTAHSGAASSADGTVISPMPGKIFKLLVKVGDKVQAGQDLLVLEAMKMEHTLVAPHEGQVASCSVKIGDLVELGQALAVIG